MEKKREKKRNGEKGRRSIVGGVERKNEKVEVRERK
jgi:hypothetical protein